MVVKKPRSLKQILMAALGKAWLFWPPRLAAKKRAKHPTKSGWWICELCGQEREKVDVDHKIPIVRPADGWISWDHYIANRFVESADALQILCVDCHKAKSKEENARRREKL